MTAPPIAPKHAESTITNHHPAPIGANTSPSVRPLVVRGLSSDDGGGVGTSLAGVMSHQLELRRRDRQNVLCRLHEVGAECSERWKLRTMVHLRLWTSLGLCYRFTAYYPAPRGVADGRRLTVALTGFRRRTLWTQSHRSDPYATHQVSCCKRDAADMPESNN